MRMFRLVSLVTLCLVISPTLSVTGSGRIPPPKSNEIARKFDEFGDTGCEDEMARLDSFAIQLQQEPQAKGVIMFFGGKTFRGKLPKRGEAEARAARLKPYLVGRRGIPANQLIVMNGGYAEKWNVQLWVVPIGASMPGSQTTDRLAQIKFRKGKVHPRDYRCRI